VELIRQAKANKEIAYELHLSEGTIKEYLNRIFRKLDIRSRTELVVWALTQGKAELDTHDTDKRVPGDGPGRVPSPIRGDRE